MSDNSSLSLRSIEYFFSFAFFISGIFADICNIFAIDDLYLFTFERLDGDPAVFHGSYRSRDHCRTVYGVNDTFLADKLFQNIIHGNSPF